VLAQVPAEGRFDYCWAEVWPPDSTSASLLLLTVADVSQPDVELRVDQLNARFGTELDPAALYRHRITRFTPVVVVAVAGLLLGRVGVRLRRLEFASAMHAGVSRRALLFQVTVETGSGWSSGSSWPLRRSGSPRTPATRCRRVRWRPRRAWPWRSPSPAR
jgi:hypothetical protein